MQKHRYIQRDSTGAVRTYRLDLKSYRDLTDSVEWFKDRSEQEISQGVLVRRAIRFYREHLKTVITEEQHKEEMLQILLARKG